MDDRPLSSVYVISQIPSPRYDAAQVFVTYRNQWLACGDDIFSRYGYVAYFFRPESQRNLM